VRSRRGCDVAARAKACSGEQLATSISAARAFVPARSCTHCSPPPTTTNRTSPSRGDSTCTATLARLETRIAISVLLDRVPDLQAVAGQRLEYAPTLTTQTLLRYSVALSSNTSGSGTR
jgi:hypothetical protein